MFNDASAVLKYHDAKPTVEQVVLCCKKLASALKEVAPLMTACSSVSFHSVWLVKSEKLVPPSFVLSVSWLFSAYLWVYVAAAF